MERREGFNYMPKGKPAPVVRPGEFVFAAVGLDHAHIGGMINGLLEAGATLKYLFDPDKAKMEVYKKMFPQARIASCEEEVLSDPEVRLVASACVPSERCALGLRVMDAGKDYFADKPPLTTLEQLESAKKKAERTGRKYAVYYSERIHNEEAVFAGELIKKGAIGNVIQTIGLGPHRLSADLRPDWFFVKKKYGGILCDIGSHQVEQFLYYTGASDAAVVRSQIANYAHPQHPELDDFGDCMLVVDNGASGYFRVDWFTPDGLSNWGDGRTFILGTEGFIELRKYMNLGEKSGSRVYLANNKEETSFDVRGKVGFPFFGQLILDCLNRTETAMKQEHAFKAAELAIKAQLMAEKIK
ncbi:MAG: Gfo/Idh/MocA family oxidoreductase [Clostridiaceae bacterium]|nr:Gfo/Idh/MocA family oxidoreductase [Clostridiaceae bacterium]